jgi:soluble lytic murein transglycosylase-like protein
MSRARTSTPFNQQTATSNQTSGCLSGFLLPPFSVLVVGMLLAFFVKDLNPSFQAESLPISAAGAATISNHISPIYTAEIQYWAESIARWAASAGLDPNLVAVVMQIESCGYPRARSRAGAIGLFQVMPYHFSTIDNPFNPDTNALRGLAYLKRSLEAAGGNARLALAGYNGGIGVISRGESTWSPETIRYVYYGYPIFEDAARGETASDKLAEWYSRYGAGLCSQAHQYLGIP